MTLCRVMVWKKWPLYGVGDRKGRNSVAVEIGRALLTYVAREGIEDDLTTRRVIKMRTVIGRRVGLECC